MCLLTFFPEGIQPDTDALWNGAFINDDGHGWAIAAGDQLLMGRGMDSAKVIEEFELARAMHPEGPALFHSRFGTHGSNTLDNCHPFYLGRDHRTVLAHNGILPTNVQPRKKDRRSDTRIAAQEFIPGLGSFHLRQNRLRVQKWMGSWNKIVVITINPKYREKYFILNEEAGTWDDGIWYSNDGYKPYTSRFGFQCGTRKPSMYWDECRICRGIIDVNEDTCPYCNTCVDCGMKEDDCLCHVPMYTGSTKGGTGWPGDDEDGLYVG